MAYEYKRRPCAVIDTSQGGRKTLPYLLIIRAEQGAADARKVIAEVKRSGCRCSHCSEISLGKLPVFADPEQPVRTESPQSSFVPLSKYEEHESYPMLDARPRCATHGQPLITCWTQSYGGCVQAEEPAPVHERNAFVPPILIPRDPDYRDPYAGDNWYASVIAAHPHAREIDQAKRITDEKLRAAELSRIYDRIKREAAR